MGVDGGILREPPGVNCPGDGGGSGGVPGLLLGLEDVAATPPVSAGWLRASLLDGREAWREEEACGRGEEALRRGEPEGGAGPAGGGVTGSWPDPGHTFQKSGKKLYFNTLRY